jgi:hemerythrin
MMKKELQIWIEQMDKQHQIMINLLKQILSNMEKKNVKIRKKNTIR